MAKKVKQRYRTRNSLEREEIIDKILEKTGTTCQFCKEKIDINEPVLLNSGKDNPRYPTFDHIIPLCIGGANTFNNLRILHKSCNSILGSMIGIMINPPMKNCQRSYSQSLKIAGNQSNVIKAIDIQREL